MEGSGVPLALIAVLAVIEQDAKAMGRPSVMDRAVAVLEGRRDDNIIRLSPPMDEGPPKEWKDEALALLGMAKEAAERAAPSASP